MGPPTLGGRNGAGTIFKITPGGTLTSLHSFNEDEGDEPAAALIQANDGNLYGTTSAGGTGGYGTVFKITPGGTLTTLYSFTFGADGGNPYEGLIQATDGNFYRTTPYTIFKIAPSGMLTTLATLSIGGGTGGGGALIQATDGIFMGLPVGRRIRSSK